MKTTLLIRIGGIINLLFAAFHIFFAWTPALELLAPEFRPVWKVLNIHLAYGLLIFFVLSIFFPNELSETKMGRLISFLIAGFWILRAVNEILFLGGLSNWVMLLICLGVGMLYIIPAARRIPQS